MPKIDAKFVVSGVAVLLIVVVGGAVVSGDVYCLVDFVATIFNASCSFSARFSTLLGFSLLVAFRGCWCLFINGEFDPGSGRTLAACLTHASRTVIFGACSGVISGERVSNT